MVGRMSFPVNLSEQVCENGREHADEVLAATNDDHGGVIVDMKDAMEPQAFLTLLRASIAQWRQQVLLFIRDMNLFLLGYVVLIV